jgi:hypothetical protein
MLFRVNKELFGSVVSRMNKESCQKVIRLVKLEIYWSVAPVTAKNVLRHARLRCEVEYSDGM